MELHGQVSEMTYIGRAQEVKISLFGEESFRSVNKGHELPQDFGQASSIVDHGMIDGAVESRMEIREITKHC